MKWICFFSFVCLFGFSLVVTPQEIITKMIQLDSGINLQVAFAGEDGTQQVMLLHGFPEGWISWIDVIPYLVESNFSLVIPDLRGYNFSDKPIDKNQYNISLLVEDIHLLLLETGSPAILVGNDWGGLIAWTVAYRYPEDVLGLVILNAPHPDVFVELLHTDPVQQNDSNYIFFLESDKAVRQLSANNFELLSSNLNQTWFDPLKQYYLEAWNRPDELKSTLNYYSANIFGSNDSFSNISTNFEPNQFISVQTLVLWGLEDPSFDSQAIFQALPKYVSNLTITQFPSVGHFPQHEIPESVANEIIQFNQTLQS